MKPVTNTKSRTVDEIRAECCGEDCPIMWRHEDVATLLAEIDRLSARAAPPAGPNLGLFVKLTPRERDVVTRLVGGASTRDISKAMGLTISTVNTYMKRIFAKLDVHTRIELVAKATGRSS